MKNLRLSKNRFGKCNEYYFTDEKITGLATTYSLPLDWPDVFFKKIYIFCNALSIKIQFDSLIPFQPYTERSTGPPVTRLRMVLHKFMMFSNYTLTADECVIRGIGKCERCRENLHEFCRFVRYNRIFTAGHNPLDLSALVTNIR